jgi:hypothetical protein
MAKVKILPEPRRSCEECLAIRNKVSPPNPRKLPRPALPNLPPNPATELRKALAKLDSPRPLYRAMGERALAEGEVQQIAEALKDINAEIALCQRNKEKLTTTYPLLYPPCTTSPS